MYNITTTTCKIISIVVIPSHTSYHGVLESVASSVCIANLGESDFLCVAQEYRKNDYKYDNGSEIQSQSSLSKVTISVLSGTVAAAAYSFGLSARNPLVPEQGGDASVAVRRS